VSSHLEKGGSVIGPVVMLVLIICWLSDNHDSTSDSGEPATPAKVQGWISQADQLLIANGTPAADLNDGDTALIAYHESSDNPAAVNGWDRNAAAGNASEGLMQTTRTTFDAYALPGHTDITDPVDNIAAGIRYALHTYGSEDDVPGVRAVHQGRPYVGY
jgi:hypothetical protein